MSMIEMKPQSDSVLDCCILIRPRRLHAMYTLHRLTDKHGGKRDFIGELHETFFFGVAKLLEHSTMRENLFIMRCRESKYP